MFTSDLLSVQQLASFAGGKGLLADEEQRLFKLRQEKEEQVQREITKQRQMFEREAKDGQLDKLCATPFGVDVVGITEFIALTGALVGGTLPALLSPHHHAARECLAC